MKETFSFNLTPHLNGGESLYFHAKYDENGILVSEGVELNSYGSCSTISSLEAFNSDNLFKLAQELKKFELKQELKRESSGKG